MRYWVLRRRLLGRYMQEGRSMWLQETPCGNACLLILQATKGQPSLGTTEPGWTGRCQEFLSPRGDSFIYSFISPSLSSGVWPPMWASYLLLKWPKNSLSRARIHFTHAETAEGMEHQGAGSSIPSHTCTVQKFPNRPNPPVFKAT